MHQLITYTTAHDSPELWALSDAVRRFAENTLGHRAFRRDDFLAMARMGLPGSRIGSEKGGAGLPFLDCTAALFELARVELGPAIYLSVHQMVCSLIEQWADEQSAKRWLPTLLDGSALAAFCLTEAGAGSDAAAIATRAVRTSAGYELAGEKIYITSAPVADLFLVFARTGDGPQGISAFAVPRNTAGLTIGPAERKMGCEGAPIASVRFDGCAIEPSSRLGPEGQGYAIALSGLSAGRVSIAACACGIASKAVELSVRQLKDRKQFGRAISEFQGLQFMLADMATRARAAIALTREAADAIDRGEPQPQRNARASVAKCFATDSAMAIATDTVQLFGGAGYLEDYPAAQLMRDAKMLQIVEGTNQIQRVLIARSLLE